MQSGVVRRARHLRLSRWCRVNEEGLSQHRCSRRVSMVWSVKCEEIAVHTYIHTCGTPRRVPTRKHTGPGTPSHDASTLYTLVSDVTCVRVYVCMYLSSFHIIEVYRNLQGECYGPGHGTQCHLGHFTEAVLLLRRANTHHPHTNMG